MIYVCGLGTLGYVTGICLAQWGHFVTGVDTVSVPFPENEPGLFGLYQRNLVAGRFHKVQDFDILRNNNSKDTIWLTWDMPVDAIGISNPSSVFPKLHLVLSSLESNTLVMLSTQVPVGTANLLQKEWPRLRIVSAPENLRRGYGIDDFMGPSRIVLGTADGKFNADAALLYAPPVRSDIRWMGYESAEMSKHALNAFLATKLCFANELADICTKVGADYENVLDSMSADPRVGTSSYLHAGKADGRHLLRDIHDLLNISNAGHRSILHDVESADIWHG